MRNILEYPITNQERIEVLTDIKNKILAEETIGDTRATIVQECIDTIKNNHAITQLGADEVLIEENKKIKEWHSSRNVLSREQSNSNLIHLGLKPGMWAEWRNNPPPLNAYKKNTDLLVLAVIDALTQEGVIAWNGDATSCVSQMIHAQLDSRKRLLSALKRIANALNADADDLRDMANDAINDETPES